MHGYISQRTRGHQELTPQQLAETTERIRLEEQAAIRAENAARRQRQIQEALRTAGVGARFLAATFDNCEKASASNPQTVARMRRWAEHFEAVKRHGANRVILGPVGTGKTWLAAATLSAVAAQGYTVAYLREDALLAHLRRAFGVKAELSDAQALGDLVRPDLLCIDEAGKGIGDPDKRRAQLGAVIDARYHAMRPVLMLSNFNHDALSRHLGRDAWDRLTGSDSRSDVLSMTGPSLRQQPHPQTTR
jgi:DNA replication protein DnaC